MAYHIPVMLNECIDALQIKPGGTYIDVTFGGGGHSKAILDKLNSEGRLIAFDQDADAIANLIDDKRFVLVNQNFRFLKQYLKFLNAIPVDGILADLGVSSHQFDTPKRGFSIRFECDLDMRMSSGLKKDAKQILNTYSDEQLQQMFSQYGEIRNSKTLAHAIVSYRTGNKIRTTADLKSAVESCVFAKQESQYMAQVFQALRIEVNDELQALKDLLVQSAEVLNSEGKLVVLTYHSLEDRLVKNFIAKGNFEGIDEKDFYGNRLNRVFRATLKKPLSPTDEELKINPRSRSAKLRVAEKL